MSDKYQQIAAILCELTTDLLKESKLESEKVSLLNISLNTRVGSGLATYCKSDRRNKEYTITYGRKMIKSKFNQNELPHWLTYREILKYNFFNSDVSIVNVFTHTVCHEFSHLIQQESGCYLRGSVHNAYYYKILNRFYESGIADQIKAQLIEACKKNGLSLESEFFELKKDNGEVFYINDAISFTHKCKVHNANVVKINKKTVIVNVKSLFKTTQWKIPKKLATKILN